MFGLTAKFALLGAKLIPVIITAIVIMGAGYFLIFKSLKSPQ